MHSFPFSEQTYSLGMNPGLKLSLNDIINFDASSRPVSFSQNRDSALTYATFNSQTSSSNTLPPYYGHEGASQSLPHDDSLYPFIQKPGYGATKQYPPPPDSNMDVATVVRLVNGIQEALTRCAQPQSIAEAVTKSLSDNAFALLTDMLNSLQKEIKSLCAQLKRQESSVRKMIDTSEKKILKSLSDTARLRSAIREECSDIIAPSEKRVIEKIQDIRQHTDEANPVVDEAICLTVPHTKRRRRGGGASLSQTTEPKPTAIDERIAPFIPRPELTRETRNLFLVDDFF